MTRLSDISVFIDPVTHHFLGNQLFDPGCRYNRDNCQAPYFYLRELFQSKGIEVNTADFLLNGQKVNKTNVYFSLGILKNYRQLAERKDVILSAFFTFEAPIVLPTVYRELPRVNQYFKRIYSYSTSEALAHFGCGGLQFDNFQFPMAYDCVFDELWNRKDRKFLTMICTNRMPRIFWNELYSERPRALEYFSQFGEIDLYGKGWDQLPFRVGETWIPGRAMRIYRYVRQGIPFLKKHAQEEVIRKVYKGPVNSKYETMSQYTFALCYENMILKGWLNEKVFDAFYAGTIPIYWGASDVTDYVPADCFIDKRQFPTYAELRSFLKSLSEKDVQRYKENARDFLRSPRYRPFTKEAFAEHFTRCVAEDTGVEL